MIAFRSTQPFTGAFEFVLTAAVAAKRNENNGCANGDDGDAVTETAAAAAALCVCVCVCVRAVVRIGICGELGAGSLSIEGLCGDVARKIQYK